MAEVFTSDEVRVLAEEGVDRARDRASGQAEVTLRGDEDTAAERVICELDKAVSLDGGVRRGSPSDAPGSSSVSSAVQVIGVLEEEAAESLAGAFAVQRERLLSRT